MDNYGTCRFEDASMLAERLARGQSIMFGYSCDSANAYVLCIVPNIHTIGILPFGGHVGARFGVGVLYRGFSHFDLRKRNFPSYVAEKLGLPLFDAEAVTLMLNAIGHALREGENAGLPPESDEDD